MHQCLFRAIMHKGAMGNLKVVGMALDEIHRAQPGRQSRRWEFYGGLDAMEHIAKSGADRFPRNYDAGDARESEKALTKGLIRPDAPV